MPMVERVLTMLGQAVEKALTGRTEFKLTTSHFEQAPVVNDPIQARMVLDEVKRQLAEEFAIRLRDPVLLELQHPPPLGFKAALASPEAHLGRYMPRTGEAVQVHRILIRPGLERTRFRGVAAHELVHAWQAERAMLRRSRGLREGMARWVEYHVLLRAGREDLAQALLRIRRYVLGRSLRTILEYEGQHGRQATLAWLEEVD